MQRVVTVAKSLARLTSTRGAALRNVPPYQAAIRTLPVSLSIRSFGGQVAHGHGGAEVS